MADKDQLVIPEAAVKDTNSFELLRVWVANKGQHVSLRTGVWSDPAAWGIMLADLAGHIANSYEDTGGLERGKVLERIKAVFDAELSSPTDSPSGKIIR